MLLVGGRTEPPLLVLSRDRTHGDSLVTESSVTHQHIQRIHQRLVAAPVDGQTLTWSACWTASR